MAFEKAAVLFNLGAALAGDAAAADLGSDAGCKRAARRFQVPLDMNSLSLEAAQIPSASARCLVGARRLVGIRPA